VPIQAVQHKPCGDGQVTAQGSADRGPIGRDKGREANLLLLPNTQSDWDVLPGHATTRYRHIQVQARLRWRGQPVGQR